MSAPSNIPARADAQAEITALQATIGKQADLIPVLKGSWGDSYGATSLKLVEQTITFLEQRVNELAELVLEAEDSAAQDGVTPELFGRLTHLEVEESDCSCTLDNLKELHNLMKAQLMREAPKKGA